MVYVAVVVYAIVLLQLLKESLSKEVFVLIHVPEGQ
jgi:hypothetical protein